MKTHQLKCLPEYFDAVADGSKPFEVRYDDRNYEVGDLLRICEWRKAGWGGRSPARSRTSSEAGPGYSRGIASWGSR